MQKNSPYWNWKLWLANTIKFSEFFTYGNYVVHKQKLKNHFLTEESGVRWIEYESHIDKIKMDSIMDELDKDPSVNFLWIQKIRHVEQDTADFFPEIRDYFHERWNK